MPALTATLQLLFLGALISPVYLQNQNVCELIKNIVDFGNYSLSVNPAVYKANTEYNVTITAAINSSSVILQAVDARNSSVGDWGKSTTVNCTNNHTVAQQNISSSTTTVQWKSLSDAVAPVEIRVFVTFINSSTLRRTFTLNTESTSAPVTITTSTTKTTSSVSTAQASSFFVAAIQMLSVFVTSKLFSC